MHNILSIDVESWAHFAEALEGRRLGDGTPARQAADRGHLRSALERILDLLDRSASRATFFALGELLEWDPEILEKIRRRGHEIGYHGHDHRMIDSPETLASQLTLSRDFIDRFRPAGFRAPRLYLLPNAMATLKRAGFAYSSSSYGPFEANTVIDGIREIPISTLRWRAARPVTSILPRPLTPRLLVGEMPFGSGMGAGLLGESTSFFIRRSNRRGIPAVIMLHPWQLFPPDELTGFGFKLKTAWKNALFLPYAFSRAGSLQRLILGQRFSSFAEYLSSAS